MPSPVLWREPCRNPPTYLQETQHLVASAGASASIERIPMHVPICSHPSGADCCAGGGVRCRRHPEVEFSYRAACFVLIHAVRRQGKRSASPPALSSPSSQRSPLLRADEKPTHARRRPRRRRWVMTGTPTPTTSTDTALRHLSNLVSFLREKEYTQAWRR